MIRYVAFLRGINVAGQKLIKMEELVRILAAAGFKNVRTYIQCGNIIFDSRATNPAGLAKKMERTIAHSLGHDVNAIVRKLSEIQKLVAGDPFGKMRRSNKVMLCVVLLANEPERKPQLPLISQTENLQMFAVKEGAAFVIARRKKNGWFGFPNAFVEKSLGVTATTRQWSTVLKLLQAADQDGLSASEQWPQ